MSTVAPPLQAEAIIATAIERAGSDDFGGDSWREGLDRLVASLNAEANLNELGTMVLSEQLIGHLVSRLQIEQVYAEHPEIDDQQIVAPLFGLGLPRTGSTALAFLLAQDRARRTLRVWEASSPCPPPETATELTDPRIAAAAIGIEMAQQMAPGFAEMLPSAPDGPQECLMPMAFEFRSLIFEGMAACPSYAEWLLPCDMVPAYRYHARVLKLLQWKCPPDRWWLKTPAHMLSIDALNEVYPDAQFVMTHRDVGQVLPSVCALYRTLGALLTTHTDPLALGAHASQLWRTALERLITFRDAGNEDRFHDLAFAAVQRDPIGQVERLYAELGDDLSADARARMHAWWTESTKDRSGPAHHTAADFGLDLAVIAEQFAFYDERFGAGKV